MMVEQARIRLLILVQVAVVLEVQEQMVSIRLILDQVVLVSNSQQHLEILPLV
tara:strand:+ start:1108 stop:1266 length:159 start_codon:yes stop_codon:yes gene_type:complete